jgi:hypothetical protein
MTLTDKEREALAHCLEYPITEHCTTIAGALERLAAPLPNELKPEDVEFFAVEVSVNGVKILTIETGSYGGISEISDYAKWVREAGENLLAFIGPEREPAAPEGETPEVADVIKAADFLVHVRLVLDALYNHNEAVRAAVIQHYGLSHNELNSIEAGLRRLRAGGRDEGEAPVAWIKESGYAHEILYNTSRERYLSDPDRCPNWVRDYTIPLYLHPPAAVPEKRDPTEAWDGGRLG